MLTLQQVHGRWRAFVDGEDRGPATDGEVELWQQMQAVQQERRRVEIERDGWRARYDEATREEA